MEKSCSHTWIIGASSGIGAALAKELANQGRNLALSARNHADLCQLQSELPLNKSLVMPLDVSCEDSIRNAHESILKQWSQIDCVIFMAGIYEPMGMGKLSLPAVKQTLEINLLGAFYVAEIVLPALLKSKADNKKNQLVFCGSVAAYRGLPKSQPYGASKAGLQNMVESLRLEHGKKLDVKLISPGFVKTRLTDKNDFHMPMSILPEIAAKAIAKGLASHAFEIHFPKPFTLTLKLLSILPYWLYEKIAR